MGGKGWLHVSAESAYSPGGSEAPRDMENILAPWSERSTSEALVVCGVLKGRRQDHGGEERAERGEGRVGAKVGE